MSMWKQYNNVQGGAHCDELTENCELNLQLSALQSFKVNFTSLFSCPAQLYCFTAHSQAFHSFILGHSRQSLSVKNILLSMNQQTDTGSDLQVNIVDNKQRHDYWTQVDTNMIPNEWWSSPY